MLFLGIPTPELAMLALRAGIEVIILDCEHGFPYGSEIRTMIVACKAEGGRCFVRIPVSQISMAGVLADLGLDGIVLAGVRTLEELDQLVNAVAFPVGSRSVNPFVPAAGDPGAKVQLEDAAKDLEIWAMAETREFLEVIGSDDDHALPVDGLLIGPFDLSATLGCTNDPKNELLLASVSRIVACAKREELEWAIFVRNLESLEDWKAAGIEPPSVVLGYDRDIWFQACSQRVQGMREGLP